MKKIIFILCGLWWSLVSHAATPAEELSELLGNITTMQANFSQTVLSGKGGVAQQTTGHMYIKRPGLFRWEVLRPSKQFVIADGRKIWLYDVDLEQVTVQKQAAGHSNTPAMLLVGSIPELVKNFRITHAKAKNPEQSAFVLKPISGGNLFRQVELRFHQGILQEMRLEDSLGQASVVKFSQVKNNPTFSNKLFHFKPPAGVDVVKSEE